MNTTAPIEALRQEFGLPAFEPIAIEDTNRLQSLSLSQLRRVDIGSLIPETFRLLVQRASMSRMGRLANRALRTWLVDRDSTFSSDDERLQVMASLADLNSRSLHDDEAMEWNKKARAIIEKMPNAFERVVEWKLRELQLLLNDKEKVDTLFRELWEVYGAKLPRLRQILASIVEELGIERPFDQGIVTTTTNVGELWSPDAPGDAPVGQKLWLPENG